jgi:hypothetical protein
MSRQINGSHLLRQMCTSPCLVLLLLIGLVLSAPLQALECTNSGAAPGTDPDDTGDGHATACGHAAVAGGDDSTALGYFASSAGDRSTAIGYRAQADQDYAVVLGATAGVNLATAYSNVGIGVTAPLSALHVHRDDGTANILVEETGAPATRTLFELQNPGRTHFKITNTDVGSQWVFTNAGNSFFISLQGTGGPEFKVLNNGDAVLAGFLTENSDVNSKQDIVAVNGQNILKKLADLEVSEWSYKDAPGDRHVGPMAQDFYAAFGLGHTDKGIATLDTSGVALAAIKALIEENTAFKEQNLSLEQRVIELEQQNQRIEELVMRMVMDQAEPVAMK